MALAKSFFVRLPFGFRPDAALFFLHQALLSGFGAGATIGFFAYPGQLLGVALADRFFTGLVFRLHTGPALFLLGQALLGGFARLRHFALLGAQQLLHLPPEVLCLLHLLLGLGP